MSKDELVELCNYASNQQRTLGGMISADRLVDYFYSNNRKCTYRDGCKYSTKNNWKTCRLCEYYV